jgi:hypothetical protein
MIEENQYYADFVNLVKEYLPEKEQEIPEEAGPAAQIAAFASHFEDRYFPLGDYLKMGEAENYDDLVRSIPLIPLGFGYQDYDDLVANGSAGFMLMTYIFRQPYDDQGARVALGEGCQDHVSIDLLQKLPDGGFSTEEIHALLDKTPYGALALWGDMINLSTGNEYLDIDDEMYGNSVPPDWSKENVEYLTKEWKEAEQKQKAVYELADKLEKKPQEYFREVIECIFKRKEAEDGADAEPGTNALPVGAASNLKCAG